jgi:hypothetical protein
MCASSKQPFGALDLRAYFVIFDIEHHVKDPPLTHNFRSLLPLVQLDHLHIFHIPFSSKKKLD